MDFHFMIVLNGVLIVLSSNCEVIKYKNLMKKRIVENNVTGNEEEYIYQISRT